ncbi:MAG: hypothetical protein R3B89_03950 [Polyangiaceae bacterium]
MPATGRHLQANGTLTSPCQTGTLVCDGLNGWACTGGTVPSSEVCDGADNDCNGTADDALGSPVGDTCGIDEGECSTGITSATTAPSKCDGGQGPVAETCEWQGQRLRR